MITTSSRSLRRKTLPLALLVGGITLLALAGCSTSSLPSPSGSDQQATRADFGHGSVGFVSAASTTEFALAAGSAVVFFPPDRYALIGVTLPDGSDAASVALDLGKAFSDVADALPTAPTK